MIMRKIWFILLMMCTVGAMSACSDDDDGDNNGGQSPVSNVYLPAEGQLGQEIEIVGDGFASTAEFLLKDAAGKETSVPVVKVATDKVTLTVPENLEPGKYTLILKQAGEWTLGTLDIVKGKLKVTRLASFTKTVEYAGMVMDEVFRLTYDAQNRLKGLSTTVDNGEGGTETKSISFEYADKEIKATGNFFDEYYPEFTLTLDDNGRVDGCTISDIVSTWKYTTDGYLDKIVITDQEYSHEFVNGNLVSVETPKFGGMMGQECAFKYGNDNNSEVIDVVNFILSVFGYSNGVQDPQFYAYLLGKAGEVSSKVPSTITYFGEDGTIAYEWNEEDGSLKSLSIPFEIQKTTISFKYETAEFDQ